jgi:hypothetical protein
MIWVISFLCIILLDTILKGTKNLILYILVHKSTKKFKKKDFFQFSIFGFYLELLKWVDLFSQVLIEF